ncbi:MAG: hypothetical protein GX265_03805 [Mollicutes bacterium]|nr:hypothetical protein [Mollicutes bacterium]
MKLYVQSNIININVLKDLKRKFSVVFKDNDDIRLRLKNNILSIDHIEIDCTSWIEKIEAGHTNLSLSDLIDRMLIEFSSSLDIII